VEQFHYNCVCDEMISLRCANSGCDGEIAPNETAVVTPDGTVFCSEQCAGVAQVAE
jgi:hypothetical protein